MANEFLVFDRVTKRFGALTAVDNVSISIKKGEFFSLLGPSGCGKTTLLRMLGGFERPDSGRIYLDGKDITDDPPNKRRVHTVFQNYALFPTMTPDSAIRVPSVSRSRRHAFATVSAPSPGAAAKRHLQPQGPDRPDIPRSSWRTGRGTDPGTPCCTARDGSRRLRSCGLS